MYTSVHTYIRQSTYIHPYRHTPKYGQVYRTRLRWTQPRKPRHWAEHVLVHDSPPEAMIVHSLQYMVHHKAPIGHMRKLPSGRAQVINVFVDRLDNMGLRDELEGSDKFARVAWFNAILLQASDLPLYNVSVFERRRILNQRGKLEAEEAKRSPLCQPSRVGIDDAHV